MLKLSSLIAAHILIYLVRPLDCGLVLGEEGPHVRWLPCPMPTLPFGEVRRYGLLHAFPNGCSAEVVAPCVAVRLHALRPRAEHAERRLPRPVLHTHRNELSERVVTLLQPVTVLVWSNGCPVWVALDRLRQDPELLLAREVVANVAVANHAVLR